MRLHRFLEQILSLASANLHGGRQGGKPLDQGVVHQRLTDFERMRHARSVDLRVDVSHQVCLQVEILNQCQWISNCHTLRMPMKYLYGVIPVESRLEGVAEKVATHLVAHDRNTVEVSFHRVASERFER